MRLFQTPQHVADDSAQLGNGSHCRGSRSQLVTHPLPIDTVEERVEMRLVDDSPHLVERLEASFDALRLLRGNGDRDLHQHDGDQRGDTEAQQN